MENDMQEAARLACDRVLWLSEEGTRIMRQRDRYRAALEKIANAENGPLDSAKDALWLRQTAYKALTAAN